MGELTAESGKFQTYVDVLTKLLETSIFLPEDLVAKITEIIRTHNAVGYATVTNFVRDAVRRRLEELKTEDFYVECSDSTWRIISA